MFMYIYIYILILIGFMQFIDFNKKLSSNIYSVILKFCQVRTCLI